MPKFANALSSMRTSEIRNLMSVVSKPGMISFAGGMPDNDLFPVEIIDNIYNNLTLKEKQVAMQYGPTSGLPFLLESVSEYLQKKGLPVSENRLLITTGSLQGINILGKTFINPGDDVIVEQPCFIGAIAAFASYQANFVTIPLNSEGILIDELKNKLQKSKPKFVYITPNFHNPAGTLYKAETKLKLIELLSGLDIPLIEDDSYSPLYFYEEDKEHLKNIKAINPKGIDVCYLGSFSKILGPGLRLGWMLVPPHIYEKVELIKQSIDACSPSFTQVIADKFLRTGAVYSYIDEVRLQYKNRAIAMVEAMGKYFPSYTSWSTPRGGFYVWVQLPEGTDATEILKKGIDKGVVIVTGKTFDPGGVINNCMRVSYCNTSEEKINKGIPLLAEAIRAVCG